MKIDTYTTQCLRDEPALNKRIPKLKKEFKKLFGAECELIVRSPGRVEIIGNHTDYNQGYTLSDCISESVLALFKKRNDNLIRVFSLNFISQKPIEINLSNTAQKDQKNHWTNYVRGVADVLTKHNYQLKGADIIIESTVPIGAGVSSSAALEWAMAYGLLTMIKSKINRLQVARLCQQAENEFVGSPCGFLDQGTIASDKAKGMVFMDFKPKNGMPVSKMQVIPVALSSPCLPIGKRPSSGRRGNKKGEVSFVVAVDKSAKRELGASGYPARRKMCEDSLSFWSRVLKRKITSLREVSVKEFIKYKKQLEQINPMMRKRVEHVVFENERVLNAVKMLKDKNIKHFGQLLTESGKSALQLYELDEKTPELTFLVKNGQKIPGVLGIRNMGGGFSATILALVQNQKLAGFKETLSTNYSKKFGHKLEFIKFNITAGVGEIRLSDKAFE